MTDLKLSTNWIRLLARNVTYLLENFYFMIHVLL